LTGFSRLLKRDLKAQVARDASGLRTVTFWAVDPKYPNAEVAPNSARNLLSVLTIVRQESGFPTEFKLETYSAIKQADKTMGSRLAERATFTGRLAAATKEHMASLRRPTADASAGAIVNDRRFGQQQFGYKLSSSSDVPFADSPLYASVKRIADRRVVRHEAQHPKQWIVIAVLIASIAPFSLLFAREKNRQKLEYI
jgi:hypothetical protein